MWAPVQDPFNAPKQWVLLFVGAWLAGSVFANIKGRLSDVELQSFAFVGLFLGAILLSLALTGFSFTSIFGEYARRNGALTYFAFGAIFLAGVRKVRSQNSLTLIRGSLVAGSLISLYGILQHFGFDIIKWNNPYNSVISTLGNPDFAGAVFGILGALAFGVLISRESSQILRMWGLINVIISLGSLYFAKVFQGFINLFFGVSILFLVAIYQWRQKVGHVLLGVGLATGLAGFAGVLNKGPLAHYLYKSSVPIRGDYWRAGWRMFRSHFWGGVGLDHFGYFFTKYRDLTQVNRANAHVLTNAAHSVPIQLAATGGIFVFLTYISLTIFIAWRAIVGLKNSSGSAQMNLAIFFAAWVAFEIQSLVSIDNIGVSVWGWLFAGAVVGLSQGDASVEKSIVTPQKNQGARKSSSSKLAGQSFLSAVLATLALILCIPMFLSDVAVHDSQRYQAPKDPNQFEAYKAIAKKTLQFGIFDPSYRLVVAREVASAGDIPQAIKLASDALKANPRDAQALSLLAEIYEQTNRKPEAITFRSQLVKLDPYNPDAMLALLEVQKAIGDMAGATETYDHLKSVFPANPVTAQAAKELSNK
jgi:O-antigen ligase